MSGGQSLTLQGDSITAIFDAVPLSAHPRLAGALSVDDPFDLEALAVGPRKHGTAMASAVVHGDINVAWSRPLERPVYFVNMLYATADLEHPERFPDRLPADMFEAALVRMREGQNPIAPHVITINASLGDPNKPFYGRMSGWARVVDYLASKYGVLFIISAGNHHGLLETEGMTANAFEALPVDQRARVALRASASKIARRRILAPAEAMNAITVGALHADGYAYPHPLPPDYFDVWANTGLCTVSSGLGPGYGGATKPEILAPGGVATRAHEALEAAYPDFIGLPSAQRASLLKALLVHGARWTEARDILLEILGPAEGRQHYKQKDNIRRYLGFGAYDPELIINCASDRATLWAVGALNADQGRRFRIPWPAAMSGQALPHSLRATLAWFSPPKPGAVAYRAVRMKIVEPSEQQLGGAGINAPGTQPDPRQAHKGTVIHRHWEGDRAAAIAIDGFFDLDVQREPDDLSQTVDFALAVTLEMEDQPAVYTQVLNRVAVQPRVPVNV